MFRCRSKPIAILLAKLPSDVSEKIDAAWGTPESDPDVQDGAFRFRAQQFGNVIVALPPDRGRPNSRRADYHDPSLPPRHALLAFGLWLRHVANVDAIVHMGAHGTLEWLPGKAVALTAACFPEAVVGPMPVIYPFIVSNPGEAAQAKRRIAAVTLGHLPPPLVGADLSGDARELERLVDEYAQADGLDRRRRERLARLIVESRATERSRPRGRRRDPRQSRGGAAPHRRLALRSEGSRHQGRPAHLWPRVDRSDPSWQASVENERRAPDRRARRQAHRAGPRRLAASRAPRRDADRAQHVHLRSAHLADADRDGFGPARRRRGDPRLHAEPRRDAARAGDRSVGQRDACAPAARRSRRVWR